MKQYMAQKYISVIHDTVAYVNTTYTVIHDTIVNIQPTIYISK